MHASCRFAPDSELQLLRDQDTTSTLFTISDVALIAGGVSVAGALLWYALRHTPEDPPPEAALNPGVARLRPIGICLDVPNGKIYFAELGGSISSAGLDGSGVQKGILRSSGATGCVVAFIR